MSSRPPIPLSPALSVEQCNEEVPGGSLSGKSVLITGGASGVGAAIAHFYAENGAYVTIADVNENLGTAHASSLQAKGYHVQYIPTDVTSWPSQITAFKAAINFPPTPTLTTVIACAGLLGAPFIAPSEPPLTSLTSNPPEPNTTPLTVNAIGLSHTAKLAQLYFDMPSDASASVGAGVAPTKSLILFTSLLAYTDFPNTAAYTASKHAVRGLFRIIRPLFAARGHRVNAIAPWLTRSPMTTPIAGRSCAGTPDLVRLFEGVGAPVAGDAGWAVRAVVRCDGGDEGGVNGRVLAAGPDRVWDMRDDREGGDGQKGLEYLYGEVVPGWDGYVEEMRRVLEGGEGGR